MRYGFNFPLFDHLPVVVVRSAIARSLSFAVNPCHKYQMSSSDSLAIRAGISEELRCVLPYAMSARS